MIKLIDLIEVAGANLCIMDGFAPMMIIDREHINPDPINPKYLEKEVTTIGVTDDELRVWLRMEEDDNNDSNN